jgi:hypothetical protein
LVGYVIGLALSPVVGMIIGISLGKKQKSWKEPVLKRKSDLSLSHQAVSHLSYVLPN